MIFNIFFVKNFDAKLGRKIKLINDQINDCFVILSID